MLMTVLKGDLATTQSIALIDAFKSMKDYIVETKGLLANTNSYLESKFASYDKRFELIENKLDMVMDNFVDPPTRKHFLIMDGERIEADIAYQTIYNTAKESLIVIDDYIDIKTLRHLKVCSRNTKITIVSDNLAKNKITNGDINDFFCDTGIDIVIRPSKARFHDRLIVIDHKTAGERIFLSGPSSKDAGNKIATIIELENKDIYHSIINELMG